MLMNEDSVNKKFFFHAFFFFKFKPEHKKIGLLLFSYASNTLAVIQTIHWVFIYKETYEGCLGSSWNLVIKFSNTGIILSFF